MTESNNFAVSREKILTFSTMILSKKKKRNTEYLTEMQLFLKRNWQNDILSLLTIKPSDNVSLFSVVYCIVSVDEA